MKRIGELDFVVENGKLFLTCDKEKQCYEWSFFTLARVPVSSEIKTNINISNYKDSERSMQLEIDLGLELEKIGNEDKNKDSFSIFFFLDDEYEDELLYSISVFNLGGKNSRTNLVPISEGSELELEGLYSKLKVRIINVKPILKF
ncbi:MAG: hypothetical protein JHC31_09505 [Sulfurihydrogenibium sp.]|jgi:hypothetical protein|nr:hypothetical protein [Sulfurihydrogenibium sp.]